MKLSTVVALVAAGAAPVIAGTGVEWLGIDDVNRVLHGENLTDVAAEIAQREFSTAATLEILDVEARDWTTASWGGKLRADDDHEYRHVRVRLVNTGGLDMPVHTRHFVAFDDIGHEYDAEWGLQHLIDATRVATGGDVVGIVVFHMPSYVPLQGVEWQGEFASAVAHVPPAPAPAGGGAHEPEAPAAPPSQDAPPRDDAPGAERGDAPADGESSDDEEYQSHWDG